MTGFAKYTENKISFKKYMPLEETSEEKHDFYFGELHAMAGGSTEHHQICQNINEILVKKFKPKGCFVSLHGLRLELTEENFYVYPDLFVTCAEDDKKNKLFKKHPSIIFEVLSDSTALYDKEVKLKYYKKIETLTYYVLVSQKEVMVEVYSRINESQIWQYQTFENMDEVIQFEKLGFDLNLADIYDAIVFDADIA